MFQKRLLHALLPLVFCSSALSSGSSWQHLGPLDEYRLDDSVLTLRCGEATVRIIAVNDHVLRVRLARQGQFDREFSWAVTDLTPQGHFGNIREDESQLQVTAGALTVIVHRNPCRLEIRDAEGHILTADDAGRGMGWQSSSTDRQPVRVWQRLPDGAAIYGLGEKTGGQNRRGRSWTNWNSDRPAYGAATDPIYKSIPFFIVAENGRYHGVFLDNPWRTHFDFGHAEQGVLSFGADGGELNYYVIAGPHPKDVVRRYTDLTGKMELPPKWAIGYHQCRYSYYPESRVRHIAQEFRRRKIPCDVIYFDIDYMDGYRCFTWHPKWFPDPKGLIDDLHEMGFRTVAIIDPGIKYEPGYAVYDSGTQSNVWLTKPDGQVYVGRVWPGESVFPDFTNPTVRNWWADLYTPFVQACGIDGIWNDMNEPADFSGPNHSVPLDLRHDNDGQPASHLASHNVYGMQMVRATMEGLQKARPNVRPFTITRATYAGGQRYSAVWTGDNISTWDHLRMSIPMCLGLGISGMPFVGPDIGGFIGGATPQLYARWIQVGSLFPFSRTHTAWDNPDQEPWSFGPQVEAIARESLERRYALLPYLYTLFEEASRTGLPIVRPLWLEFPGAHSWGTDQVFMLGSDIYVAPHLYPDARPAHHFLPEGVWFDWNTGLIHAAGQPVPIDPQLSTLPMFVRAGAIIPMQSPVQSTAQAPEEPLILDVWPFGESSGTLYEDDGQTLAFRQGQYRRTEFSCQADDRRIKFEMAAPQGTYRPAQRSPLLRLHGLPAPIKAVHCELGEDESGSSGRRAESHSTNSHPSVPAPGQYYFDAASSTWFLRMFPDTGERQTVRIQLATDRLPVKPVKFDFNDLATSIAYAHDFQTPRLGQGTVRLRVQGTWDPYVVLPRVQFDAESLPHLRLRIATEHAQRMELRVATREQPWLLNEPIAGFELQSDAKVHEYVVDLAAASGGKWKGTVYCLRLDLEGGNQAGDILVLDQLVFEPSDEPTPRDRDP